MEAPLVGGKGTPPERMVHIHVHMLQGSCWDPESGQECTVAQDLSGETPGCPEVLVLVEHL